MFRAGKVQLLGFILLGACTEVDHQRGVVVAASPEAAQAGAEILQAGGNAIDAAVAVQFALGVTEPAMSGLGGQTQMLVQRSGEDAFVINGTSFSPAATRADASDADIVGHKATTIPATVKSLDFAWREYGSGAISWAELLAPAIRFADSGFVVGEFRRKVWKRHRDRLVANPVTAGLFLTDDGSAPAAGSWFRQPQLAVTLRQLAAAGADDFYNGSIARQIAKDMQQNDGWITGADLASIPEPTILPALSTTYRGYTIATLPPPGGGWVVLQLLNLLELTDSTSILDNEIRVRTIANTLRIAHSSRQQNPITNRIDYEPEAATRISKETARTLWQDKTTAPSSRPNDNTSGGETTHFSIVDGNGMAVSVTASVNAYFGARAASPELGFLYNDYMNEFELGEPTHPFALKPGAMPYSSMSPTIVSKDDGPVLVLGSPGSARIVSTVAQVIHRWIDLKEPIADAVAAPRIHVIPARRLYLERGVTSDPYPDWARLEAFEVTQPDTSLVIDGRNAYYGGVHAIAFENDVWHGAADPRRDGAVRN